MSIKKATREIYEERVLQHIEQIERINRVIFEVAAIVPEDLGALFIDNALIEVETLGRHIAVLKRRLAESDAAGGQR